MHPRRSRPARVGVAAMTVAIALVALLLNLPLPARAGSDGPTSAAEPTAALTATVTWNGADVSMYGSTSSALSIDFSQQANLNYVWSNAPAPGINDVRLQMFYFGFAVITRDVTLSTPQTQSGAAGVALNWTPLSIAYVLEGLYKLTASLIAPNGTSMWSENFYVRGNAPFGIAALIPIVLLLIAIYEIYALARSGRYAMLGRKSTGRPPEPPPAQTPSGPTSSAPPAEEPPADAPSAETPPPEGGSS